MPPPVVAGLDPSVVVANSVAADVDLLFICNREAGVYVARSKEEFNKARSGELLDLILLGQLKFDNLQSVNHVEFENEMLFIAAGLGCLKIVRMDQ